MKSFKSFIKEETMPYANVKSGVMDINDSAVRDQINQLLAGATGMKFVTPYIGMERVAKTLANFHIFIPSQSFLEGDSGNAVWPVSQYGLKFGQTNDGDVVAGPTSDYSVYFEYRMSDCGMFMVFCEIVDQDELDEILDDLEDELNGEDEDVELDEESGYYYGKQTVSELKMSDEQQMDEVSAETVGKLKKAVDLGGKKLKTDVAKKTLDRRHKKEWLKSNVGVMKEDQLDEVSKGTLASYIKKASHDVATKSAATGRYAERANKEQDARKKGDYSGYQQGRKDNAFADKMFAKSWKRRANIALAADKLAKESVDLSKISMNKSTGKISSSDPKIDLSKISMNKSTGKLSSLQELSSGVKARYVKKAEKDKAHAERQAAHSEYTASHASSPERKAAFKDEAKWLKGIAAKRAKGIALAKK